MRMRFPHHTHSLFRLTAVPSDRAVDYEFDVAEDEQVLLPEWLSEHLATLCNAITNEPLPERFVRLIRQLNEVEDM